MGCVYLVTHKATGKQYVGKTTMSFAKRWYRHCHPAKDSGRTLDEAIAKFGPDAFDVTIIEESDDNAHLLEVEKQEISVRNTLSPRGFNLTRGGTGSVDKATPLPPVDIHSFIVDDKIPHTPAQYKPITYGERKLTQDEAVAAYNRFLQGGISYAELAVQYGTSGAIMYWAMFNVRDDRFSKFQNSISF